MSRPQNIYHWKDSQCQARSRTRGTFFYYCVASSETVWPSIQRFNGDLPCHPGSPLPGTHRQKLRYNHTETHGPHHTGQHPPWPHNETVQCPPTDEHCTHARYNHRNNSRFRAHSCAHPLPEFHSESLSLSSSASLGLALRHCGDPHFTPKPMQLAGGCPSQSPPGFRTSYQEA